MRPSCRVPRSRAAACPHPVLCMSFAAQVAHIMRAVVRFIAQCHAKGLIYRDIKPGGLTVRGLPIVWVLRREGLRVVAQGEASCRWPDVGQRTCAHNSPPPSSTDNFLLVNKVKRDRADEAALSMQAAASYSAASDGVASEPEGCPAGARRGAALHAADQRNPLIRFGVALGLGSSPAQVRHTSPPTLGGDEGWFAPPRPPAGGHPAASAAVACATCRTAAVPCSWPALQRARSSKGWPALARGGALAAPARLRRTQPTALLPRRIVCSPRCCCPPDFRSLPFRRWTPR